MPDVVTDFRSMILKILGYAQVMTMIEREHYSCLSVYNFHNLHFLTSKTFGMPGPMA